MKQNTRVVIGYLGCFRRPPSCQATRRRPTPIWASTLRVRLPLKRCKKTDSQKNSWPQIKMPPFEICGPVEAISSPVLLLFHKRNNSFMSYVLDRNCCHTDSSQFSSSTTLLLHPFFYYDYKQGKYNLHLQNYNQM